MRPPPAMRDGEILADDTPHGLLEETGTVDTEDAFLAVIDPTDLRRRRPHRNAQ